MKKISLLLFLMVSATNVYSQNTSEDRALKITNEMSEVLSLDDDEKEKVYEIQIKRYHEVAIIRSTYAEDLETKKAELKKVYNRLSGKLKSALGKDKMKEWRTYKQK
jgi:hypothetical protein|tara:strand:+ start:186 stop:506 length:321 start_codon:yes stop_codon:yes gene_type:complete